MSFPRYPAYRDSGVAWLGEVPAHWEVCALKRVAHLQSGLGITSERIETEGDFPVMGGNGLRGYTDGYTHDGCFALVGRQGALCGNVNYGRGRFWASEHAIVVNPIRPAATFWLGEMLRAMNLNQYSVSAAQPGLAVEMLRELRVAYPPLEEQEAIADYLFTEVEVGERLLMEQQRLIALLKEKRQAVISHAVTKGLDPHAPMKDSGVEWLGEVPAHWAIRRVKNFVASLEQGWSPQCENYPVGSDADWGVLKVGCVNGGVFRPSENKALPTELEPKPELGLSEGDILISRANTRELVGSVAVVPRPFPRLMVCDKLYRIRVQSDCNNRYLALYLSADAARGQIELEATGASSSMLNIGQSTILEMRIPLPPLDEQSEICEHVAVVLSQTDALIAEAERAIALLQERRSALISAAVTGKIDVRRMAQAAA